VLYGDHYSGKTTLTSANFGTAALASIMVPSESFPKASLVTPDYIKKQQEVCYTGAHHQAGAAVTQKKQLSLIVSAVSALTTTSQHDDRSMPSPRRRREQPAFIPLPGKKDTPLFSKKPYRSIPSSLFLTLVLFATSTL
jgi:hypothetical protein